MFEFKLVVRLVSRECLISTCNYALTKIVFTSKMDKCLETGILPCGLGGIGRRARLRGVWETVPVQVRQAAPFKKLI